MAKALKKYPWGALERLSRADVDTTRIIRRAFESTIDLGRIGAAASALLGVPVGIDVRAITHGAGLGDGVTVVVTDGARGVSIRLEDALAFRVVGAVLGQPAGYVDPRKRPAADIAGAASAFMVALARRASPGVAWRLGAAPPIGRVATIACVVIVGDDVFDASVTVAIPAAPPAIPAFDRARLGALGAATLTAPVVGATFSLARQDATQLGTGAALVPGPGWTIRFEGDRWSGAVVVIDPASEVGVPIALAENGDAVDLVVASGAASLPWTDDGRAIDEPMPIVVRIEIGDVGLPAATWAGLSVGDVIASRVRFGGPVIVRANGVIVAEGVIIVLEGELAVRITTRRNAVPL